MRGLVHQFAAMRRGAVLNCIVGFECENRQVLHTACRDIFSDEPVEPVASRQAKREIKKLETLLKELEKGKVCNEQGEPFTTMVHIGVGGSDLGPLSIFEALLPFLQKEREAYFISTVDSGAAAAVLRKVNLRRTLVNVVSKSGTTLETLANETFIRRALKGAGLDPSRHCIAVIGEGSPMDNSGKSSELRTPGGSTYPGDHGGTSGALRGKNCLSRILVGF